MELTQTEQEKERRFFFLNDDNLRDLCNIKQSNANIIGILKRRKEKEAGTLFEVKIAENFPNPGKKTDQIQ